MLESVLNQVHVPQLLLVVDWSPSKESALIKRNIVEIV